MQGLQSLQVARRVERLACGQFRLLGPKEARPKSVSQHCHLCYTKSTFFRRDRKPRGCKQREHAHSLHPTVAGRVGKNNDIINIHSAGDQQTVFKYSSHYILEPPRCSSYPEWHPVESVHTLLGDKGQVFQALFSHLDIVEPSLYVQLAKKFVLRKKVKDALYVRHRKFRYRYLRVQWPVIYTHAEGLISLPFPHKNHVRCIFRVKR